MADGINNSLQDLLLLRTLRDQADPFRSGIQSLAQGVSQGIEEQRLRAKKKREQEDNLAQSLAIMDKFGGGSTNAGKMQTKLSFKTDASGTLIPSISLEQGEAQKPTATQIAAAKEGISPTSGRQIQRQGAQVDDTSDFGLLNQIANKKLEEDKAKLASDKAKADKEEKQQLFANANTLRDDFIKESDDFNRVKDSYGRVLASTNNASAAGDLSLIFNFMKMLDPNSVVRESEFATAAATGAYGERIRAAVLNIQKGERVSPAIRADFVSRAKDLFETQGSIQSERINVFTGRANRVGINPEDVVSQVPKFDVSGQIIVDKSGTTPSGNTFRRVQP